MRPFFSTLWRFYDYRSIMVFRLFRVGSGFGLGGYRRLERLIMKKRILILLMAALFSSQSMSAALPAYSPKFGNAMAGVVQQKVAARGFAANDPRFIATEAAIGTVLTGCVFHAKWPPVPRQSGHPVHAKLGHSFHAMADSRSVATRGCEFLL